tara:strand:+ start:12588 stop:13475 length:888 start_codon:yes stop_codon:yes gene_type:complete
MARATFGGSRRKSVSVTPAPAKKKTAVKRKTATKAEEPEPVEEVIEEAVEVAVEEAPPQSTEIVSYEEPEGSYDLTSPTTQEFVGEEDASDFIIPRLTQVYDVGGLSEDFAPGSLLLNGEYSVVEGNKDNPTPVNVTFVGFRKYYEEHIEWGEEQQPRRFGTLQEVQEAGLHIDWREGERPSAYPVALATCILEAPEGADLAYFPYVYVDGEGNEFPYALCIWKLKGSAYTSCFKPVNTSRKFACKPDNGGLKSQSWDIAFRREKRGENLTWVPSTRPGHRNDESFMEFVNEITS